MFDEAMRAFEHVDIRARGHRDQLRRGRPQEAVCGGDRGGV
jgi:hypothetical protein